LTYSLATKIITLHRPDSPPELYSPEGTFWDEFSILQDALSSRLCRSEKRMGRWRGGWIGWCGYEMKEESLVGYRRKGPHEEDIDACWSWAGTVLERTVDGEWIARGITGDDHRDEGGLLGWLQDRVQFATSMDSFDDFATLVENALDTPVAPIPPAETFPTFHPVATGDDYRKRIDTCREAIRQGESYELTLTTRFESTTRDDPYSLWLRLRKVNPAYYSTYISLPGLATPRGNGIHILSSSPERFLRIDENRQVEMMPIKGTRARVKPGQCVCAKNTGCGGQAPGSEPCNIEGRRVDKQRGEDLSNDKKERAENLMVSSCHEYKH
jgi:para-aminobenzoate synthetase